jgi:hypothetical protein
MSSCKTLLISSEDGSGNSLSELNYDLTNILADRSDHRFLKVRYVLLGALPNNVITGVSDSFILAEDGQAPVTVVIPEGNYTATNFATTLKDLLDAASPTPAVYTVTYSAPTAAFTFASATLFSLDFNTPGAAWFEMGFAESSSTALALSTTSTQQAHLEGPTEMFISFPGIGTSIMTTAHESCSLLVSIWAGFPGLNRTLMFDSVTGALELYGDRFARRQVIKMLYRYRGQLLPYNVAGSYYRIVLELSQPGPLF